MVRRALRKIVPPIPLAGTLYETDELPRPWDTVALFGRAGDLIVEIGSGKGLFLVNAALARPDCLFLGIELARKYAEYCAARACQRELANVRVVRGDAVEILSQRLPDSSAAEVHIYFPDPWWKKRHRRRRLMQMPLVGSLERVLRPGGRLHFWTDVEDYFAHANCLLREQTQLEGPLDVVEQVAGHDMDYRTHFERRVRVNELPVFRAEYVKRQP
jgi:tRNA (guanine-N7-)-methyltransferase